MIIEVFSRVHTKRPLVLTILDGWGYRAETANNAIALARKPTYDKLLKEFPNTLIRASEHFVGLPDGQMGNSEVGHLNIGAGRIVQMDITRIDALIAAGEFGKVPTIVKAMQRAREGGRQLHLFGLVSDGGVHSHQEHLYALLRIAREYGLERVFVHAFMDGRDTLPTSGAGYIAALEAKMREYGVGKVASINGRYYAMDRDKRWERERKAFDAMVNGKAEGGAYQNASARIKECYNGGTTDEFLVPFVVMDEAGKPVGQIRDEDVCINFNFRADRARQITRVLARESGLNKTGRARPGWMGGAGSDDSSLRDSERPALPVHDAVRQALRAAAGDSAGVDGQHSGQCSLRAPAEEFARGGDGEVCARDLLLQRRHRSSLPWRRARPGAIAQGCNLRPGAGDAGRGHRRRDCEGCKRHGFRSDCGEFCECRHGGPLRQAGADDQGMRGCGRAAWAHLQGREGAERQLAHYGRPWQRRIDGGPGERRPAHRAHDQPGAHDLRSGRRDRITGCGTDGSLRDISPTLLAILDLGEPKEMTGGDMRVPITK